MHLGSVAAHRGSAPGPRTLSVCSPEGDDASGGGQGPPLTSAGRERNTGQLQRG